MTKVLVVAKWEYLEKVKSKAFLIGLLVTPLIMVAMGVLPGIFAAKEEEETKVIGVVDIGGDLAGPFSERMESKYLFGNGTPKYLVRTIAAGPHLDQEKARKEGDALVLRDEIEGFFIINSLLSGDSVVEYRSKTVADFRLAGRAEKTLKDIVTERRLVSLGLDSSILKKLDVSFDLRNVKLSKKGEESEGEFGKVFFTAYIFLMMLFFLIFTSGQLLVRSVIEEKSNRIVEVLVSSCSPTQLMAGKVLGLSGLGFTQIGFWGLIGIALSLKFQMPLVPLDQALLLLLYFVLGYLFYAAVFIALGSPLTTEQEAQQVSSYLVMVLIIPIVLALPAMQTPNATWLKILTFIPLLTPTMMALRIPIQMPSMWEIVATSVIMLASIYAAMWIAGRIFRVALLATGKRASLSEIARWVRTG